MKIILLALAIILWWVVPVFALGSATVTASTTVGCVETQAKNYTMKNDGDADIYWSCSTETVPTTNKAPVKATETFTADDECPRLCYKTTSGTATLRVWYQPR